MMTKILLLLLLALFPFCAPLPASADLLTSSDVPLVPKPDAEVVAFGLQAICLQADQKLPITALDVLAGQGKLSRFSTADQFYVRYQFQKYEASPAHFAGDLNPQPAAKTALPLHDLLAQELGDTSVSFVLHPYLEIIPNALSLQGEKNAIVAYGQPVNANSLRFAGFLRNLSAAQKIRLLQGSPLTISGLRLEQRLFVSDLWQASSHPECARFCSMSDTQVTVGFYLEAVITRPEQSGFVAYHLQLPQPAPNQHFFASSIADGQQGQVWERF